MNPYDKAHELARAIEQSPQYSELRDVRQRIEDDPSTFQMLQDFRKRQLELQAKQWMGQTVDAEAQQALGRLAEVVMLNRDVSKYLELENFLQRIVTDVQDILMKSMQGAVLPLPLPGIEEDEEQ